MRMAFFEVRIFQKCRDTPPDKVGFLADSIVLLQRKTNVGPKSIFFSLWFY